MFSNVLDVCYWLLPAVLLGILFGPIALFLGREWDTRRREILGLMTEKTVGLYFKAFKPSLMGDPADKPALRRSHREVFAEDYYREFGRRRFIFPCVLLAGIAGPLILLGVAGSLDGLAPGAKEQPALPPVALSAIAGAYLWVAFDLIVRSRTADLSPSHLLHASLRFAVAVPVGFAFAGLATESVGMPVAFMVGAFPTRTLMSTAQRLASRQLALGEDVASKRNELEVLQGVSAKVAERLAEEDLTTVLQLAYADPIRLFMRTGYSFSFVVDCVNQSLAWLYLEEHLGAARLLGLRGAQEIGTYLDELGELKDSELKTHLKVVMHLGVKTNIDADVLLNTLREIAKDPYCEFIRDVW